MTHSYRGYNIQLPPTPSIRDRPAYGGTCTSLFSLSQTVTVLKYNTDGSTDVEPWIATASTLNAYAHPIDGFAASFPTVGCGAYASNSTISSSTSYSSSSSFSSPATSSSATASLNDNPTHDHAGVIAGAVVGSVLGLVAVIGIVFLLLRRRRRRLYPEGVPTQQPPYEKYGRTVPAEVSDASPSGPYDAKSRGEGVSRGLFEMNAEAVHEMPDSQRTEGAK
jgi:hypothetical protein